MLWLGLIIAFNADRLSEHMINFPYVLEHIVIVFRTAKASAVKIDVLFCSNPMLIKGPSSYVAAKDVYSLVLEPSVNTNFQPLAFKLDAMLMNSEQKTIFGVLVLFKLAKFINNDVGCMDQGGYRDTVFPNFLMGSSNCLADVMQREIAD